MLYLRRGATRCIVNEAELAAQGLLRWTTAIAMHERPLTEQLLTIAAARGLVGVHGQALAYIPFLGADAPTHHRPQRHAWNAVLEVLPPPVDGQTCNGEPCETSPFKHTYEELSRAMGVVHLQITGRLATSSTCTAKALRRAPLERRLRCNLTVPPMRFAARMRTLRSVLAA